jgi:hypothetical protein
VARFRRGKLPSLTESTDRDPELAEAIGEHVPARVGVEPSETLIATHGDPNLFFSGVANLSSVPAASGYGAWASICLRARSRNGPGSAISCEYRPL